LSTTSHVVPVVNPKSEQAKQALEAIRRLVSGEAWDRSQVPEDALRFLDENIHSAELREMFANTAFTPMPDQIPQLRTLALCLDYQAFPSHLGD
jgi:hypothetical protein